MYRLCQIIFPLFHSVFNTSMLYLRKIPGFNTGLHYITPYLVKISYLSIFYFSKLQIYLETILPTEKKSDYLSLYCIEDKKFIDSYSKIVCILKETNRDNHYLLKFKHLDLIGRLYVTPDKIINGLQDIVIKNDNTILSAIYESQTSSTLIERDVTDLLNEYLICNFTGEFKLSDMIDDTENTLLDSSGKITIINNLADSEIWDINKSI